jgi:AcrR family transcriptional regulator
MYTLSTCNLTVSTLELENMAADDQSAHKPYHFGNLREALLEVSLELISESGVPALTLREIASRLGVSRMAPYRHFADKAAILAALAEIGFSRFSQALEQAAARAKGPMSKLEELAIAYVRFANLHRAHFEVMFGQRGIEMEPEALSFDTPAFGVLLRTVAEAQAAGRIRPGSPKAIAHLLWATVHGISLLGLETDWEGDADFTRQTIRKLRVGLKPD